MKTLKLALAITFTFLLALAPAISQRESRQTPNQNRPGEVTKPVPGTEREPNVPQPKTEPTTESGGRVPRTEPTTTNDDGRIILAPQKTYDTDVKYSKEQKAQIREINKKYRKMEKNLSKDLRKEEAGYQKALENGASQTELSSRRQRVNSLQEQLRDVQYKHELELRSISATSPKIIKDNRRTVKIESGDDDDDYGKGLGKAKNAKKIKMNKGKGHNKD